VTLQVLHCRKRAECDAPLRTGYNGSGSNLVRGRTGRERRAEVERGVRDGDTFTNDRCRMFEWRVSKDAAGVFERQTGFATWPILGERSRVDGNSMVYGELAMVAVARPTSSSLKTLRPLVLHG